MTVASGRKKEGKEAGEGERKAEEAGEGERAGQSALGTKALLRQVRMSQLARAHHGHGVVAPLQSDGEAGKGVGLEGGELGVRRRDCRVLLHQQLDVLDGVAGDVAIGLHGEGEQLNTS